MLRWDVPVSRLFITEVPLQSLSFHRQSASRAKLGVWCLLVGLIITSSASAQSLPEEQFPLSAHLRAKVRFWERVFRDTSTDSFIIHDQELPNKIIDIVDFATLQKRYRWKGTLNRARKQAIVKKYVDRYNLGIARFKKHGKEAIKFGLIEERLYQSYFSNPVHLNRLMLGRAQLRSQGGLREEFLTATKRAEKFLPFITAAFKSHGVPEQLAKVAFVESMFNEKALSKVGASGIWQFMPSTAKHYLHVNQLIDERSNPYKASMAAAKLMKDNYRLLGTWPLAVTAYNHGTRSLQSAIRKLGTKDIDLIVQHHRAPGFGFASKNFYAEFVAVYRVYTSWQKDKTIPRANNAIEVAQIPVRGAPTYKELLDHLAISPNLLRQYNPEFSPKAETSLKYKRLPDKFALFLPVSVAQSAKQSLMTLAQRRGAAERSREKL